MIEKLNDHLYRVTIKRPDGKVFSCCARTRALCIDFREEVLAMTEYEVLNSGVASGRKD